MANDPKKAPKPAAPQAPAAAPPDAPRPKLGGDTIDIDPEAAQRAAAADRMPSDRGQKIYLDAPAPETPGAPAPDGASLKAPRGTGGHRTGGPSGESSATAPIGPGPGGILHCGEYELIREVGRGGMGRVYLARAQKLNRLVALKMLLAGPGAGLDQIRRLMVEAKTMAALEHANVVRVFDVGVEGDIHYFTMEYVDGPSLSEVMHTLKTGTGSSSSLPDLIENLRKRKGSSISALDARAADLRAANAHTPAPAAALVPALAAPVPVVAATRDIKPPPAAPPPAPGGPAPAAATPAPADESTRRDLPERTGHPPMPAFQAAVIIEKCARALAHAHARGIIHRDLKPGNILMRAADDPVVLDFGLARQVALDEDGGASGPEGRLTVMGQVLGTPAYMAPEQARGEIDLIDEQSDTYSLGAILYEMLTGREVLSPSRTIGEALYKIQTEEPIPPSRLVKRVPGDLETITLKALQKVRAQRYANAEAFAEDLRRLREGAPILARPQGFLYRTFKFVEKYRLPLSAAGLVAAFFLVLTGTLLWRGWQQERDSGKIIAQQLIDLQTERATAMQRQQQIRTLEGQLIVNEFKDDFSAPADLTAEKSPYRVGGFLAGPPPQALVPGGYWRVLGGRLNGRAGVKHSAAERDQGLLFFNRPLLGDVTIRYEIVATPLTSDSPPEIAFVLNGQPSRQTDGGYFVSIKTTGTRVRRLGAEVHGGPGFPGLTAGRRYYVRIEKVDDRLSVYLKPAEPGDAPVREITVVDFRDADPISGEELNRFGWYIWRSEVQIFNFSVSRPVPARPRPIHFAHKLFNRGEYAMARSEYNEVSRIGFGTRSVEDVRGELRWIQDDGVEADFRIALCNERLADHEPDKTRAEKFLGDAEAGYISYLYDHRPPAGQPDPYPELRAQALAHLAICYMKHGWQPQADGIIRQLAEFSAAENATAGAAGGAALHPSDAGWAVLAEYALAESAPALTALLGSRPVPAAFADRERTRRLVVANFNRAAEFAVAIRDPRLCEETAKSILQAIRMADQLGHSEDYYITAIDKVYTVIGRGSFTAPDLFLSQLCFHEEDLRPELFDRLMTLAQARHAPAGQLESHRAIRLCDQEDLDPTRKLAALKACYAMPGADLAAMLRCGELARDFQDFELAHQFFARALDQNAADLRHREIYRGLGCAMYDNGERVKDASQRVRGIADLLAAADFGSDPDVLDEEAVRIEGFIHDHAAEHAALEANLKNTCTPAVAQRRWGLFCLCAGRFDDARSALQAATAADPAHPLGLYLQAVALSHGGQPGAAVQLLERARLQGRSSAVLDSLSALQMALDDFPGALKTCERANDLRPFNETANGRRAYALARLHRWPEAEPAATLGLDLDFHNRPALVVAMGAAVRGKDGVKAREFETRLNTLPDLTDLNLDSKIRQNTRIKLPREIGFANVTLQTLPDFLPPKPPGPIQ